MWQRIRRWINSSTPDDDDAHPANGEHPPIEDTRLADLHVSPDDGEDFDAARCEQLLNTLTTSGATTVGDVLRLGVRVTLEQFFAGNRCKHSIAANVCPDPPFDTSASWFDHLKSVRDHPQVQDVLVQIYMVEPYEDRSVRMWPYADTIWVYADLSQSDLASLLAPLDPDEVRDASVADPDWNIEPPTDVPSGSKPFWVWWD